ncbi:MAG: tetratricopeptide repeat protein, partial [Planctomycetales bacterium]|nr:tetratricopeptide repeat protein [Planctomycetales bacterium]
MYRIARRLASYGLIAFALLSAGATLPAVAAETPDPFVQVKSALRAADYAQALRALEQTSATDDAGRAEALFLRAKAQEGLRGWEACVDAASKLVADYPDSRWRHKARFLQAEGLAALKRYGESQQIYLDEAQRLLDPQRKDQTADVILAFADAFAKKPDPSDLGAPPPDYAKADELYSKALELEISQTLRDHILLRRIESRFAAGSYDAVIADATQYLTEYDPHWNRTDDDPAAQREDARVGQHCLAVRIKLIEAELATDKRHAARMHAEDLLALLKSGKEPFNEAKAPNDQSPNAQANVQWLLVRSYALPAPAPNELDKALQVAEQFLQDHPRHAHALESAVVIADTLSRAGRTEAAIDAWTRIYEGQGFALPEEPVAATPGGESPEEALLHRQSALYSVGRLQLALHRYDDAKKTWTTYIQMFPNGPQWADCQRGVVDADFQEALDATGDAPRRAQELLERFLTAHPLDGRAAQVLYLLGSIEYDAAYRAEKETSTKAVVADTASGGTDGEATTQKSASSSPRALWLSTIQRWQRLTSKYPRSDEASLAQYRIGQIYEEKLKDHAQALDAYRRLNWGPYENQARVRLAAMTENLLRVTTERTYRTDETPVVSIATRNIDKLTIRRYALDLEAYFRRTHGIEGATDLDIDLIQPDRTWEVEVQNYIPYAPLAQNVEIPFEASHGGVCLISVSGGDLTASTIVVRSDIDLIVKSSRREVLAYIENRREGKPCPNARVLVSDGCEVFATGTTNADGVFQQRFEQLRDADQLSVFAVADESVAAHSLSLAGLEVSQGLSPKAYLITDRPAYQPGQTIRFRGVLRDVVDGSYTIPQQKQVEVAISDQQNRVIWQRKSSLSEFGTLHDQFELDDLASTGEYRLSVTRANGDVQSATFRVERYSLQKARLEVTTDREVYFRGETVHLTAEASYYW